MDNEKERAPNAATFEGPANGSELSVEQTENTTQSKNGNARVGSDNSCDASGDQDQCAPGFRLDSRGVMKLVTNGKTSKWIPICGWLKVKTETRDEKGESWGKVLVFKDSDGQSHQWIMPWTYLAGDGRELREALLNRGLKIEPGRKAREGIFEYVTHFKTPRRAVTVTKVGWHADVFVLPNRTIGQSNEEILLRLESTADHAFFQAGTLEIWQQSIGRYAIGNSRLILALSAAAAAPTLKIAGAESGGFHFHGESSKGKSTLLEAAGSAWGGGGKKGHYWESWHTTGNALESTATMHNDCLLCLDEISQVGAAAAAGVAYMLANGMGKGRANTRGEGEPKQNWRTVFLSTGEMTLGDKIAEDPRQRRTAGQAARVADIYAEPDGASGIYENLHDFASGEMLSDHIKLAAGRCYGVAGPELVRKITDGQESALNRIRMVSNQFMQAYCPNGADGQVSRVAKRFALVAAAGELAIEFGIYPWPDGEAMAGVGKCFNSWLMKRGGNNALEEIEGFKAISHLLQLHGSSRFEAWDERNRGIVVHNRIGWKRLNVNGEFDYYLPSAGWGEICRGFDPRRIAARMADRGLMHRDSEGKTSKLLTPPGYHKMRLYHLSAAAVAWINDFTST